MNQNTILFASGDYTVSVANALKPHNLKLIVTSESGGKLNLYAKSHGVPIITSDLKSHDDIRKIKDVRAPIAALASYGHIIPQEIIDIFPQGILNIHPSLLPKYKGPSPIQSTILNGDDTAGVTIIKLDNEIDHGPIAYQVSVKLTGHETTDDLKRALFKVGAELLGEILTGVEQGKQIRYQSQDHSQESLTEKITKDHGKIDPQNPPDKQTLKRMIRAYYPWPGVFAIAKMGEKEKRVKLLPKNRIQVEGKNVMTLNDFLNGYGESAKQLLESLDLHSDAS